MVDIAIQLDWTINIHGEHELVVMFDQATYKGRKIKQPQWFEPLVKTYEAIPFLIPTWEGSYRRKHQPSGDIDIIFAV